jgi:hypothetical protein
VQRTAGADCTDLYRDTNNQHPGSVFATNDAAPARLQTCGHHALRFDLGHCAILRILRSAK